MQSALNQAEQRERWQQMRTTVVASGPTVLGHRPVIDARVGDTPALAEDWVVDALVATSVPDISDAVGRLYTMSCDMRPLYFGMPRLAGTAITVKAPPGDNWAIHGGLSLCGRGHVLVVDWQGYMEGAGAGVQALVPAVARGFTAEGSFG